MAKVKKELSREERIVANAKAELNAYAGTLGIELDEKGEVVEKATETLEAETEEEEESEGDSEGE